MTLNAALFDRAISWLAAAPRAASLARARSEFERHTGIIANGTQDYEARIAHFLEHALCTAPSLDEAPPIAQFAAESSPSAADRVEFAGWLRSHRSLYRFERFSGNLGVVHDRIGGARFHFEVAEADRALRAGDCFDGRLLALGTTLWLSPGRVFHPQEADAALEALLGEAAQRGPRDKGLLDPLLRMRSRFMAFESIRAEHVYRLDAIDAEELGAPWARAAKRSASP